MYAALLNMECPMELGLYKWQLSIIIVKFESRLKYPSDANASIYHRELTADTYSRCSRQKTTMCNQGNNLTQQSEFWLWSVMAQLFCWTLGCFSGIGRTSADYDAELYIRRFPPEDVRRNTSTKRWQGVARTPGYHCVDPGQIMD